MDTQLTEEEIEAEIKLLDEIVWNDNFISTDHDDIDDSKEFKSETPPRMEYILSSENCGDKYSDNFNSGIRCQLSHTLLKKWNAQVDERNFTSEEQDNTAFNDWISVDNNYLENNSTPPDT